MTKQEAIRELNYDPHSGVFTWKNPGKGRRKNLVAGGVDRRKSRKSKVLSYRKICGHYAHRLAWFFVHGEIPDGYEVDHIDGDGLNNRISNLRLATKTENMRIKRLRVTNSSGFRGVSFAPHAGKWRARITIGRKGVHLGYFSDINEAILAREAAEGEMWK